MKNVRNGSIYFNNATNRLERALAKFNSGRVWTSFHGSYPEVTKITNLRMATKQEVESYLEKVDTAKVVSEPVLA